MESLLSIVDSIFGPIVAFFTRTFGYAVSCEQYVDALHKEMDELRSKRDDVKREVDREARQGMEATNEVTLWLTNVELLEAAAARIHHDFAARADPSSSKLVLSYHLSKRADEARDEACSLKAKSNFYKVADRLMPVRFEERPSALVVGADSALERLRSAFADEGVGVVGILGMGGVGKTALLSRFNNEVLIQATHLHVVISIKVTRDFDVEKMQQAIGDRLGLSWDERKSADERAMVLFKVLSKMSFVLLLDDLWEPLDLATVGIPTPAGSSKSKIILTTRIEDVCDRMDARKMKVDCLEWEDAWELFRKKAGERLISADDDIRRHAEDLARRCGGLPLALITVGRAMASKRTAKEWRHAVATLANAPWQLLGMEESVLHPLKLSYDKLGEERLRTFLLYSSLHADMAPVHKTAVIDLCIGEGVIDDFDDPEDAYSEGYHLLGLLKAASLLESSGEDYVKMHPIVRAMVSWIVCDCGKKDGRWLVLAGAGLPEAPDAEKWESAGRISLMSNDLSSLPEDPHCPELLTLLLGSNRELGKIPGGFFQSMPCLKVLDLSRTLIKELPPEIGNLLQLQYIDLCETGITSLPKEVGNLTKLRSLLLSNTPLLKTIPNGVIAGLSELRVLCMYASYGNWRASSSGTGIGFEELEGLKRLRYLDLTLENASTLQRLSRARRLAISTRYLHIRGCLGMTTLRLPAASLGRWMKGLRCLRISHSSKLEEIGVGSGGDEWSSALPNLHVLMLQQLPKARIVFEGRSFPNLRFLHIWYCSGMEQLIKVEEEAGEGEEETAMVAFPHLKELHLVGLPELKSLGGERRLLVFPCLRVVEVSGCPKLKELRLAAEELMEIQCSHEWWSGLEWKDERIKEAFEPLFARSEEHSIN